eukprot:CCRYP_007476-RA/>CCRYP_007476-RA protein AED:0.26 eAED:0.26 QI:0/0/0/1/1/1/4/0/582
MTYQLVPPDDHRRNVAEKAIQTWKDHFVAVISGTADKFPLHLWCQLIPHMERQLNLLRQSNANPKISAYAHLYGPHDYNAAPFAPLGMEALAHDKPHRRKTYAQHCSRAAKATQRRTPPDMLHAVLNDETGTDTIAFIQRSHAPQDRWKDVTYGRIVANFRPEKEDPYRIRLTVGGNRINYPGDCGTPTADMITAKILLNSAISTLNAKFMTIDIKDFYLNTPMARPEYMRLKLSDIPAAIIDLYKLRDIAQDGYVFVRIQKVCMDSHRPASLHSNSSNNASRPTATTKANSTPFLDTRHAPICFALCVDDFESHPAVGLPQPHRPPLHARLLRKAGQRFRHSLPNKPQHQPYPSAPRTYGSRQQLCATADTSPALGKQQKTFVQEVIGVFLYYARAVDCTMLTALGSLATQQAKPTTTTLDRVYQFLIMPYHTPTPGATYRASDMILAAHSDASYLSESHARSRLGHFFLSENDHYPTNNGAVLTISQIIKVVMSSAAEAELGALYINAREVIPLRHLLLEMGHPQPPTPIQTDNSTALGVVTNTIQPKRTKAMDMRFHWLRCRINQKHFRHTGARGHQLS